MNIRPIPNELLGSAVAVEIPTENGIDIQDVFNVRVEREEAVTDYTSQNQHNNTKITVWYDYANSYPSLEFAAGMRVRYGSEVFEIVNQKVYSADSPHHCRFEARKIGDLSV